MFQPNIEEKDNKMKAKDERREKGFLNWMRKVFRTERNKDEE